MRKDICICLYKWTTMNLMFIYKAKYTYKAETATLYPWVKLWVTTTIGWITFVIRICLLTTSFTRLNKICFEVLVLQSLVIRWNKNRKNVQNIYVVEWCVSSCHTWFDSVVWDVIREDNRLRMALVPLTEYLSLDSYHGKLMYVWATSFCECIYYDNLLRCLT